MRAELREMLTEAQIEALPGDPRGEYLDGGARIPANILALRSALDPAAPRLARTILVNEVIATDRRHVFEARECRLLRAGS